MLLIGIRPAGPLRAHRLGGSARVDGELGSVVVAVMPLERLLVVEVGPTNDAVELVCTCHANASWLIGIRSGVVPDGAEQPGLPLHGDVPQ